MKKAKHYWSDLKPVFESGDMVKAKEAIGTAVKSIILEIDEIIKMRNAKLNSAMVAIIKDQDKKWNSVVNKSEDAGYKWLKRDVVSKYCISNNIVTEEEMVYYS